MKARGAPDYYRRVDRVASVMRVIDKLAADHLKPEKARAENRDGFPRTPRPDLAIRDRRGVERDLRGPSFRCAGPNCRKCQHGRPRAPRPGARLFDAISSRLKT
jgi:hypothetical protein